jgi:hypothetical protein
LTLNAGTAAVGPYTLTISGTGGGLTRTTSVSFTVTAVAAGFSLSANPASLTVQHGKSASDTIAITRTGGFSGAVSLSTSALPAGVTASFSPNPAAAGSSVLTISAAGNATRTTFPVTVTGTSAGQPDATATISVTIR